MASQRTSSASIPDPSLLKSTRNSTYDKTSPMADAPSQDSKSPSKVLANLRTSPYRYITGKPMHISNNFEDVRNLFYGLSGESNVLEANSRFLAFALSGAGGRMTVLKCKEPGRLKPVAGSDICDFSLSIIEQDLLATASEDAKVRLWRIPETGLSEDISTPIAILSGHNNRVHHVQFHPFISDVLLSTSIEQLGMGGQQPTVRLWDIAQ